MILLSDFYELLNIHPKILVAFEETKQSLIERHNRMLIETNKTPSFKEFYNNTISNFIHGAFIIIRDTEIIATSERLRLRTANINDYDFIDAAEKHEDSTSWVNNWPLGLRIEKFGDADFFQTIVETNNGKPVGFIDFRDMLHEQQLELKRTVIVEKGKGYGKEAMYLSQKLAFEVFNKNRLHLGTKKANVRAQHVYKSTGFTLSNPEKITKFHIFKESYFASK